MGHLIPTDFHEDYADFLTPQECQEISIIILNSEKNILNIDNHLDNSYYSGTTKQFNVYNWLNHPDFAKYNIHERIFNLPIFAHCNTLMVQCWANILRFKERIGEHVHAVTNPNAPQSSFYACNLFISGNTNTTTWYEDTGYTPNAIGTLSCISPHMLHKVPTHLFSTPRISMAMDIYMNPHTFYMCEQEPNRFNLYERSNG